MQLVTRNHFAGVLEKHRQYWDGLIGNPDFDSAAAKLSGAQVQPERAKAEEAGWAEDAHRQHSWYASLTQTAGTARRRHGLTRRRSSSKKFNKTVTCCGSFCSASLACTDTKRLPSGVKS